MRVKGHDQPDIRPQHVIEMLAVPILFCFSTEHRKEPRRDRRDARQRHHMEHAEASKEWGSVFDGKRNKAEHIHGNYVDPSDSSVRRSAFVEGDNQHACDQADDSVDSMYCNHGTNAICTSSETGRGDGLAATVAIQSTDCQIPKVRLNNGMYCGPDTMIIPAK